MSNFNSIKVRLELGYYGNIISVLQFQFHKGTIRTARQSFILLTEANFNSIKVRLELWQQQSSSLSISNFNSIKVRLEQGAYAEPFSHYKFQFHKGTIRTSYGDKWDWLDFHFNSIKVRLEPGFSSEVSFYHVFQFHKGTIRTNIIRLLLKLLQHFNSIKVRLELARIMPRLIYSSISIP